MDAQAAASDGIASVDACRGGKVAFVNVNSLVNIFLDSQASADALDGDMVADGDNDITDTGDIQINFSGLKFSGLEDSPFAEAESDAGAIEAEVEDLDG